MAEQILIHDVSNWQGDLSKYWQMFWDRGCRAVIIKATEGLAFYQYFKDTAEQAKAHGFLIGSYHYFRQKITNTEGTLIICDPIAQAQNHFDWIKKCSIQLDLPPAIDIEKGNNPTLSATSIEKFLSETESLFQRTPMIYSNPNILNGLARPSWIRYPLWLANYAVTPTIPAPWKDYTIWQFSDSNTYDLKDASGNIISRKPIDHDWFNGNMDDLLKFCQTNTAPIPPPVTDGKKYVETIDALRGRTTPNYVAGDSALIFKKYERLEDAGLPLIPDPVEDIQWRAVIMYVSNKWVKEV